MHGLRHSAGFIQSRLATRLQTRFTPVIQFVLDLGVKKSIEMTRLINEALAQSPPMNETPGTTGLADGTAEDEAKDS
jgi:ribosome-binding factor A